MSARKVKRPKAGRMVVVCVQYTVMVERTLRLPLDVEGPEAVADWLASLDTDAWKQEDQDAGKLELEYEAACVSDAATGDDLYTAD